MSKSRDPYVKFSISFTLFLIMFSEFSNFDLIVLMDSPIILFSFSL